MDEPLTILLIDGESDYAAGVVRSLGSVRGVRQILLSAVPKAALRHSRYVTLFEAIQRADDGDWLRAIQESVRRHSPDVILAAGEVGIRFLCQHRKELECLAAVLPVPAPEVFETACDKGRLAELLARTPGLNTPYTVVEPVLPGARPLLERLTFPILMKPRYGAGGVGIRVFQNRAEYESFVQRVPKVLEGCILQSLIPGHDIDCSVLCHSGRIVAHTIQTELVRTEGRFTAPTGIRFLRDSRVLEQAERLMATLGWNGVAHIDLRHDESDGKIKIIEINPRFWGSLLGSLAVGVNFAHLSCLAAMGRDFPAPSYLEHRYIGGSGGLLHTFKGLYSRGGESFRFRETGWRFLLGDPLPEMALAVSRLTRHWRSRSGG